MRKEQAKPVDRNPTARLRCYVNSKPARIDTRYAVNCYPHMPNVGMTGLCVLLRANVNTTSGAAVMQRDEKIKIVMTTSLQAVYL